MFIPQPHDASSAPPAIPLRPRGTPQRLARFRSGGRAYAGTTLAPPTPQLTTLAWPSVLCAATHGHSHAARSQLAHTRHLRESEVACSYAAMQHTVSRWRYCAVHYAVRPWPPHSLTTPRGWRWSGGSETAPKGRSVGALMYAWCTMSPPSSIHPAPPPTGFPCRASANGVPRFRRTLAKRRLTAAPDAPYRQPCVGTDETIHPRLHRPQELHLARPEATTLHREPLPRVRHVAV